MEIIAFIAFLALFIYVGIQSAKRSQSSTDTDKDYLMAGREVSPILTALSAAASKFSGYMFVGLVGYIYTFGLSAIWLVCGFLFGDLVVFAFVHKKLRHQAGETNALSFADLISRWNAKETGSGDYRKLRLAIGLITLIFLTTYAAAQFSAGGKALQVLFGWHFNIGIIIGAGLILSYCLTGGLRASIWTDAVQSIVMIIALLILLVAALVNVGGIGNFFTQLNDISPSYLSLGVERFGSIHATILFALGWLFNGIGVTGQPHIMVRFMALDQTDNIKKVGVYYFMWSTLFLSLVLLVGLATRLFVENSQNFDAELALPTLATMLLPSVAVGIIMGGIFAAVMSTTDSQILSCSAVLSEDFKIGKSKAVITLIVTLVSLGIALFASSSVFALVILAWSALACTMGPLVIVHALGKRPSERLAFIMMFTGFITAFTWRQIGLSGQVYEGLPGIIAPLIVFAIGYKLEAKTREGWIKSK